MCLVLCLKNVFFLVCFLVFCLINFICDFEIVRLIFLYFFRSFGYDKLKLYGLKRLEMVGIFLFFMINCLE